MYMEKKNVTIHETSNGWLVAFVENRKLVSETHYHELKRALLDIDTFYKTGLPSPLNA